MSKILVVEPDVHVADRLTAALKEERHEVFTASDGESALHFLEEAVFDVLVADVDVQGRSDLPVVEQAVLINSSTHIIVTAVEESVDQALEYLSETVADMVVKPFRVREVVTRIRRGLQMRSLHHRVAYLEHTQKNLVFRTDDMVGVSPRLQDIKKTIRKVAPSDSVVLITGETGTGKELVAGNIHKNSPRREAPFIKVNCAALQDNLLESELFGHEKGAFTGADRQRVGRFEQANGGTLFLDEIGDMSASTQAKVLRVLQEQEFERLGGTKSIKVDVRVISATNKDLALAIENGEFRRDLYYRLNVVTLPMPPLRERKEDVILLADFFIKKYCAEFKKRLNGFHPQAIKLLKRHSWPGNIRELENTIERAVLMAESDLISADDLAIYGSSQSEEGEAQLSIRFPPEGVRLADVEKQLILEALRVSDWIQKDAAALLGISRRVINYKIRNFGIRSPKWTRNR